MEYFVVDNVTKKFGGRVALDGVSLRVDRPSIVALVGKNGSGKTTLLRLVAGLYLPTRGTVTTLGTPSAALGAAEYSRIGMSHQHDQLIGWMSAGRLMRYVASYYDDWDRDLQESLTKRLALDPHQRVDAMSPGTRQRLSLLLAVCHRSSLLLLDEPISDLDPVVRGDVMELLLDRFRKDDIAMIVSSHLLQDIEQVVDRVVCLDEGRVIADAGLDELIESFAEWTVVSPTGALPERFDEPWVISRRGDRTQAVLTVRDPAAHIAEFSARYGAEVAARPLNLDRVFRSLVGTTADGPHTGEGRRDGAPAEVA